jgi:copper oxidase (laccase) domain-containing protein
VTALEFELLGGGRVLFTDRDARNLSSVSGDGREDGADARASLREAIGAVALARGYQVHGACVRWLGERPVEDAPLRRPQDEADGQATALARVGALVLTADCLPVALGAGGAIAMLHAGWRGLAAGVLEQGVRTLRERAATGSARRCTRRSATAARSARASTCARSHARACSLRE